MHQAEGMLSKTDKHLHPEKNSASVIKVSKLLKPVSLPFWGCIPFSARTCWPHSISKTDPLPSPPPMSFRWLRNLLKTLSFNHQQRPTPTGRSSSCQSRTLHLLSIMWHFLRMFVKTRGTIRCMFPGNHTHTHTISNLKPWRTKILVLRFAVSDMRNWVQCDSS